jgi:hypothetical protein
MVDRIFGGETLDDILGGSDAVHAEDVFGIPFQFLDVEFRDADDKYKGKEGSIDVFSIAHVTNLRTGERMVVTTGSVTCCSALLAINMRGLFPFYGKYEEGNETRSGYRPKQIKKLRDNEIPSHLVREDEEKFPA